VQKMKIIPAIDLFDGHVVRLYKGDPKQKTIYSNDPIGVAKKWEDQGADMLHIVDLDATLGKGSNLKMAEKISSEISIPCQVAGGLRNISLIEDALRFSDRIVIGTLAFRDKDALQTLSDKFSKERIVISADHNNGNVVINGWQTSTQIPVIESIQNFLGMGFTEFLLTNVSRDGTLEGPDLEYLRQACSLQGANVIASGGISKLDDIKNVKLCNAFGVILGKAMYDGMVSITEAKKLA